MTDYDFIGDVHGHSDKLEALLIKLGYKRKGKSFKHQSRKAFFVGDYIDRGPNNPRVVEIVRSMVDADAAIALCGNHEHNAICFNHWTKSGYLRPHTIKNFKQHSTTLLQFQGKQNLYDEAIAWFKTLPLYIEAESFNAVHAAYDAESIEYLRKVTKNGILSDQDYDIMADETSKLFQAVEITCKGKEIELPNQQFFYDKDGTKRFYMRTKWWINPKSASIKDLSVVENIDLSDIPAELDSTDYYDEEQKPVFFGHYWLNGLPTLLGANVCCLDFSVAKAGYLVAYRFSGEAKLDAKNFYYV